MRTGHRSAPGTARPSWPPCATSRSACTAKPAPPTSPQHAGPSAGTPDASSRSSDNAQINFAGALGCLRTLHGAEAFCAIRSYLATARKHGTHFFDALTMLAEGNPWLPATS